MKLFFDTETTGFPNNRLNLEHEAQPHLVQLAAQLVQDDGRIMNEISFIVDPGVAQGIKIPKVVSDIHGITEELALTVGIKPWIAVHSFISLWEMADTIVAHNIEFDLMIINIMLARHFPMTLLQRQKFCTMAESKNIINLPPTQKMINAGFNKPKPPKLSEAIKFFFDEELEGAHNAMIDVVACRRVYFAVTKLRAQAQASLNPV